MLHHAKCGCLRDIGFLNDAVVCPAPDLSDFPGVWAKGKDFAKAATWRTGKRVTQPLTGKPTPTRRVEGRHLWGGVYFGHFGHFITETISRLWARDLDAYDSVVFVPRHGKLNDFTAYQKEVIDLFLKDYRIQIVREPTEFEELIVPGQGFGLGAISSGTPEFRDLVRKVMADVEPEGPEKIYVSRTRFSGKGGIIGEKYLEANMAAQGYIPIYPEKMSIMKQLSVMKAARKIVGLDSSAFHLLGFVATAQQDACLILRRNHLAYRHIADHIAGFTGKEPAVVDAVVADWMPDTQKMADHVSWGELDEKAVVARLDALGFLEDAGRWTYMTDQDFAEGTTWSEARHKERLVRRPAAALAAQ
ncbi:MAG: glycosyltransferase family 61 protein [Alphaproteobacteria bacterium]|nr:glycosyltransferase family 61 protein [Alphaproteobacteria bacterium]